MIDNRLGTDIESLELKDVIDITLLQNFQNNFAQSMGIASTTVDRSGNPVITPSCYTSFCRDFIHSTKIGDDRCAECHRSAGKTAIKTGRPCIYTCHAGLIDFAAPIMINGQHIGTVLGGQVLIKKYDESVYRKIAKEICVDENKLIEALKKIKIVTEKKVMAAAELLYIFANSLSKIGYEGLQLKNNSKLLKDKVSRTSLLLAESQKVNELMTQQFSMVSHELKTPLNIIYSSIQLLESYYKDSKLMNDTNMFFKYSDMMKKNCYRLTRLINNIVDTNKIESGFFNLDLKNNNIIGVIENTVLSVVEYANSKNINIVFDTNVEEKIIAFDQEKIERVILNLLSNAIKFTESGGKIKVNVSDKIDYILISVKDNGIGIPENMLKKVFDNFTQVDASFRRNAEGSGMGLYITKSLIEMHGGDIKVKSKLGAGSEFIIKLPVKTTINKAKFEKNDILNSCSENVKIELSEL